MQVLLACAAVVLSLQGIVCPPVIEKPTDKPPEANLLYYRYLQEVFMTLHDDPEWVKRIQNGINMETVEDGSIARHLEFVSHNVRSKLDEIKRKEIDRLRELAMAEKDLQDRNGFNDPKAFKMPRHLDLQSQDFTIDDLKTLIKQTTSDLEEADQERKKEFKDYEMEKEHLRREKLKNMGEQDRKKAQEEWEAQQAKHKNHPKLNHPGSKDQLEEVWEEQDHMDKEDFNPKTFFTMHDINGDQMLDQGEVEALFQKELDKAYDPNAPEDDMMERYEEMNRMREHVFSEFDKDKDWLISYDEFEQATKSKDFETPDAESYQPLDEERQQYSDDEFKEFEEHWNEVHPDQKIKEVANDKEEHKEGGGGHKQGGGEHPSTPHMMPSAAHPASHAPDTPPQQAAHPQAPKH